VFIPTTDLIFYCLGSGEYDEMAREWPQRAAQRSLQRAAQGRGVRRAPQGAPRLPAAAPALRRPPPTPAPAAAPAVAELLRLVIAAIRKTVGKPPTESVLFEKYAKLALVVDEVVSEVGVAGVRGRVAVWWACVDVCGWAGGGWVKGGAAGTAAAAAAACKWLLLRVPQRGPAAVARREPATPAAGPAPRQLLPSGPGSPAPAALPSTAARCPRPCRA
jgi:hypothetical protein